jgi:hypothetical protein
VTHMSLGVSIRSQFLIFGQNWVSVNHPVSVCTWLPELGNQFFFFFFKLYFLLILGIGPKINLIFLYTFG